MESAEHRCHPDRFGRVDPESAKIRPDKWGICKPGCPRALRNRPDRPSCGPAPQGTSSMSCAASAWAPPAPWAGRNDPGCDRLRRSSALVRVSLLVFVPKTLGGHRSLPCHHTGRLARWRTTPIGKYRLAQPELVASCSEMREAVSRASALAGTTCTCSGAAPTPSAMACRTVPAPRGCRPCPSARPAKGRRRRAP
jgi:hypothetical protein